MNLSIRTSVIFVVLSSLASAAVPDFITYSGRITDGSYDGLSAQATITFRLFDAASGGTMLWEHEEAVVVQDGYFSVMLGAGVDGDDQPKVITAVFAEHGETWMELEVGGQVLTREKVGSVPYGALAGRAERVEIRVGGERLSVNAVFRGITDGKPGVMNEGLFDSQGRTKGKIRFPAIPGGGGIVQTLTGYAAAKKACEVALGSPTAHMCTDQEMIFSVQMGIAGPAVPSWVSAGASDQYPNEVLGDTLVRDCQGWTAESVDMPSTLCGRRWSSFKADWHYCDTLNPVACCDFAED